MSSGYILVVDDEPAICELIQSSLEMAGYNVKLSANGQFAHQMIINERPDLVIMDWMMPMLNGLELARRLKRDERTNDIPLILLSARTDEDDRLAGFEVGADDYVTKPFSPRELLARVRAILRRTDGDTLQGRSLAARDLSLDTTNKRCVIADKDIHLGPLEFRLLEFFMRHPDRVYSRTQLLDRLWGGNVYVEDRTVDVHIRRLRKAISHLDHQEMIQTVRGSGYRFSEH